MITLVKESLKRKANCALVRLEGETGAASRGDGNRYDGCEGFLLRQVILGRFGGCVIPRSGDISSLLEGTRS